VNGITVTLSSSRRLSSTSGRSTRAMRSNISWWLVQMIPIVMKLSA